ncbi:glycosyltransferase family 39 protein [Pelagibacteraceae bacterium]|nr:glycosyltransferase family 39 protein [Pelagibacteraceae bacterium]
MQFRKNYINKNLIIFLFTHLIVWTLVPTLSNNNLPLDTIEALAWGSNLEWGFDKHPPLSAFFLEFFYQIFGSNDWAYYFLSQIFVVSTFFIIFKFSKYFFQDASYGLISVLLLESIYFYNFTTPEFNVNVCQLPFWALSVLYCWKALEENKIVDWLLFGLFAALGVLSKYLFIYLLVAIDIFFLYLIVNKKIKVNRNFIYKCSAVLLIFLIILSPHLFWLVNNDYVTITYGLHRTGSGDQNFLDHFIHPIIFLSKQIGILIPFFIICLFLFSKFKIKFNLKSKKLVFLLFVSIVPIFLIFLTSMIMGVKIRTMWMTPFYLFFGVLFVYIFKKHINLKKTQNFISVFLVLFILSPLSYLFVSLSQKDKRTDYPGKEIAIKVQESWDNNFNDKISYVSGDEWVAGNLSYHLKSRPKWIGLNEVVESKNKLSIVNVYENNISKAISEIGYFKVYGE